MIEIMRRILTRQAAEEVNGFIVDIGSARAVVHAWNTLTAEGRRHLESLEVDKMVRAAHETNMKARRTCRRS